MDFTQSQRIVLEVEAKMGFTQSDRIALEVFTNLNTRFILVPLCSDTLGDITDLIKSTHMDLFPNWGEVEVVFMEDDRHFRLIRFLLIRDLFWNKSRGTVYVELICSTTNNIELARLNIARATRANVVSNHELHQNPTESTPSRRRGLAEEHSIPNLGNSSFRKSDLDGKVVDGTHGHGSKPEVVERLMRTMKRGIDEHASPSDAGERQVQAECAAVDVLEPAAENICDDRANPVLKHAEPETGVFTDNQSVRRTMLVVEPTTRPASCGRSENGEQFQLRKVSLPEPCQHSSPPLLEIGHEIALHLLEPVGEGAVGDGARALVSSGGSPSPNGVFEHCEEVKTESREIERLESDKSSGSPSGGSSDETSAHNPDYEDKVLELPGDYKIRISDGSSAESEGEEGSKPVSLREGSVGKNSDQTSSNGDSSQPSSVESESENLELSSDDTEESDQTPPRGGKVDFTTPKDDSGAARSIGRRSFGGSKHQKYQQLLASQNGKQKSIVMSGSQQELQPSADSQHSLAPVSLVDDSHPENFHGKCLISDEQINITTSEAVEKMMDIKPTQKNATVMRSFRQKEKRTTVSMQDVRKEGRFQGRSRPPTSMKLGGCTDRREELIPSGEVVTETGLQSGEEPPQGRSKYSQRIREALQLARMSAANGVDFSVETPSKERKKGIASPLEAAAVTHEESIQQKERHIRGESVDLLPEGDDRRLEADLLSPGQIVAVVDGLGKVLPASQATQVIKKLGSAIPDENQIDVAGKVASNCDVGKMKQRKRTHKVCHSTEVTQQDIRLYMTSGPSQGLNRPKNLNDEAGSSERKTPKKRKLAADHVAIENVVLGLQQDVVPESLNKDTREGTEEKKAGRLDSRYVCTICDSTSYAKESSLIRHLWKVHKLGKDDVPNIVLRQVNLQEEVQLHGAVNQKDSAMGGKRLVKDTEPPNLGFEDLSQRASIDDEIEKGVRRVTGPAKEFDSQESAEVQFGGEPTQSKQRMILSVEFSEDPSRRKKSRKGKKGRDSNQDLSRNHSAPLPEEVDLVTDTAVQVEETEKERERTLLSSRTITAMPIKRMKLTRSV